MGTAKKYKSYTKNKERYEKNIYIKYKYNSSTTKSNVHNT